MSELRAEPSPGRRRILPITGADRRLKVALSAWPSGSSLGSSRSPFGPRKLVGRPQSTSSRARSFIPPAAITGLYSSAWDGGPGRAELVDGPRPCQLPAPEHDDAKSGAPCPTRRHGSAGASMSDVEISGGPSGIRTQDRFFMGMAPSSVPTSTLTASTSTIVPCEARRIAGWMLGS